MSTWSPTTSFALVMSHALSARRLVQVAFVLIAVSGGACGGGNDDSSVGDTVRSIRFSAGSSDTATAAQHVVLAVKGMYCASCEQTVTTMLKRTPGVLHVDVSVARGEAIVRFDSTRTSSAGLVKVIETLGYDAEVKGT